MLKDAIVEVKSGRILFACPSCGLTDGFPPEVVQGVSWKNAVLKCHLCSALVVFNIPKIETAIKGFIGQNPALKNPLTYDFSQDVNRDAQAAIDRLIKKRAEEERFEEAEFIPVFDDEEEQEGDQIIVIDYEETFRDELREIFKEIAVIKAYRGSRGAPQYIKKRGENITLIIMDVFLGDGTCFEVLDRLRGDERASKVPVIIVYSTREDAEIIKRSLSSYPQVKFTFLKKNLLKKLEILSEKMPKKRRIEEER
jgi:CheY-like chemotaxis protein